MAYQKRISQQKHQISLVMINGGNSLMGNSKRKIMLIVVLILLLGMTSFKVFQYHSILITMQKDPYHVQKFAVDNQKIKDTPKIIVIGDSIIARWKLPESVNNFLIINRGIGSETTDSLIGRFNKDVLNLKPEYIVILSGINDEAIMYKSDPKGMDLQVQKISNNISIMVKESKIKGIKPVVCSILPVSEAYPDASDINLITQKANIGLIKMAEEEEVVYCDFWPCLIGDSDMLQNDYVVDDGIHPNEVGYEKMWEKLKVYLE